MHLSSSLERNELLADSVGLLGQFLVVVNVRINTLCNDHLLLRGIDNLITDKGDLVQQCVDGAL